MDLYFSQYFGIDPSVLEGHGAFDISLASDLPLFIDPFLLFHSQKPEYQELHHEIIRYLKYLRDQASEPLSPARIKNLYSFKEVRQNWLGFTLLGNGGSGLGAKFATALHGALGSVLSDFGDEKITEDAHLEKVTLIKGGVGRDNISDFTTNLIKDYLCRFTERFAQEHVDPEHRASVPVTRAAFNYSTGAWETRTYDLPVVQGDFVLLTPIDMLTRDETWINHADMLRSYPQLPAALPDDEMRSQVDFYFRSQLKRNPTQSDRDAAAQATISQFPELLDHYIALKEERGDEATARSADLVDETRQALVDLVMTLTAKLQEETDFYERPATSYVEALARATFFKEYIEDQDGYRLLNPGDRPFSLEKDVQLFFGLVWCGSELDVNREPNNGRGPVDFKASYGSGDKSLIEFKLGSNTALKRNLQKQVEIYEAANKTHQSVKVIVCYTATEMQRVQRILRQLDLLDAENVLVIDARNDNKPTGSKA